MMLPGEVVVLGAVPDLQLDLLQLPRLVAKVEAVEAAKASVSRPKARTMLSVSRPMLKAGRIRREVTRMMHLSHGKFSQQALMQDLLEVMSVALMQDLLVVLIR